MINAPLWLVRMLVAIELVEQPDFLASDVAERPGEAELQAGVILREVRGGFPKWAHLKCPWCGEHIELPLAGSHAWRMSADFLGRPTITPSVWQTGSCGAHFFVRQGKLLDVMSRAHR
jgi:hypothetical protein